MFSRLVAFSVLCLFVSGTNVSAQRVVGRDTIYGNEWIDRGAEYLKVGITQTGVITFGAQRLADAGWSNVTGSSLSLWHMGQEVPLVVTSEGVLTPADRLSFIHDAAEVTAYEAAQVEGPRPELLSTVRRLVSDTVVYYLKRGGGNHDHYRIVDVGPTDLRGAAWSGRRTLQTGSLAGFHKVDSDREGAKYSSLRRGEGWATKPAVETTVTLNPVDALPNPAARLSLRCAASFTVNTHVRSIEFGGVELSRDTVGSAAFLQDAFDVPADVSLAGTSVGLVVRGLAGTTDLYSVGDVSLEYSASNVVRADGPLRFTAHDVRASGGKVGLLGLASGASVLVYHPRSKTVFRVVGKDSVALVIPGLADGDELQVSPQAEASPATVRPFTPPRDIDPQTQYLVITSRKTFDWEDGGAAWSAFRQNPVYGGYRAQVVAFEDLVDLYGFGIPNDPQALRAAITSAVARGALQHVLLLGKGRHFTAVRTPAQLAQPDNQTFYCPTYGFPASDILLAYNPLLGQAVANVGRVAAESSAESAIVLRKTRAAEDVLVGDPNLEALTWIKEVLHISGGSGANEQATIQRAMLGMERALSTPEYGPSFTRVSKSGNVPVQTGDFETIFRRINEGAGIVTFFGHGSLTTFEIQFNQPERFKNAGKYPTLLAYGCYAGNACVPYKTIGERFLLMEDKGFSSFAATTGLGYIFSLQDFGSNVYRAFAGDNYRQPLSRAIRTAINDNLSRSNYIQRQQGEQFLLQGDPALVAYKPAGPDIIVDTKTLRVGPEPLIPSVEDFEVNVELVNLGRGIADTFDLIVERSSPQRPRETVDTLKIAGFAQRKTVRLSIPSWNLDGAGLNQLYFTIAGVRDEAIMAGALQNNSPGPVGFFVADARVRIVYPVDGERIAGDTVRLFAEFGRPFDGRQEFTWQLSEREDFATVLATSTQTAGSLSSWLPTVTPIAGRRYFARCRTEVDTTWSKVTFSIGEGDTAGMDLQTPSQFLGGTRLRLSPLLDGKWAFDTLFLHKEFQNTNYSPSYRPHLITGFESPYVSMRPWDFVDTAVALLVVNNTTGYEIGNTGGNYGSIDFGTWQRSFSYHVDTKAARRRVVNFIDSVANEGQIVFFFTVIKRGSNLQPDAWVDDSTSVGERTLLGVLREQGAKRLDDWIAKESVPYTFIFRKGVGPILEDLGESPTDITNSTFEVPLPNPSGKYISPRFGPFVAARSVSWAVDSPPGEEEDELRVEVLALTPAGDTIAITSSAQYVGSYEIPEASRGAHPYYLIRVTQSDTDERTPNAVTRLSVDGDLRPELVYDPDLALRGFVDTVVAGSTPQFEIGLRNVSPTPITQPYSLQVNNVTTNTTYTRDTLAGLPAWGTSVWRGTYAFPDERAALKVGLELVASPLEGERIASNNIAFTEVQQNVDEVAPTIRVLVDGEQLRDRDLLAPSPVFTIQLRDDLKLDPTSGELPSVRLTLPDGTVLAAADLPGQLTPMDDAADEEISFRYAPGQLADGEYAITVRASDTHGNKTEAASQTLRFEITNAKAISNVLPYPNPMVDRVRFQYELTGEVPSDYQINIFTTSGRLVRSLGPPELGALKIGRQLTSGVWDGTDQFGQRLARGTYLYRFEVASTSADQDFEQRSTGADRYFKSGFGKLVVLR